MEAYIETKRLILRNFKLSDAKSMFESYCQDLEVTRYLTWHPYSDIQVAIERLKEVLLPSIENENTLDLAITLKGSDNVIGSIGTVNDLYTDRYAEIGYVLAKEYWNQGYMSEALSSVIDFIFTHTSLTEIKAMHYIENIASGLVMKKCGMIYEGKTWVKKKIDSDEMVECLCYKIDKKDWKKDVR